MRYSTTINQVGVADAGLLDDTDIIDWHIIDYVQAWMTHPKSRRLGDKVWINLAHLLREMPLLGIKSKGALSRRLSRLVRLGLLECERDTDQRLYVQMTEFCHDTISFRPSGPPPRKPDKEPEPLPAGNGTVAHEQRGTVADKQHSTGNNRGTGNNEQNVPARPGTRPDSTDYQLASFIWQGVQEAAPKTRAPNLERWADTLRLMRQRDGLHPREIARIFRFANQHEFWRANILSPDKLRKQFARLDAEYRSVARSQTETRSARPPITESLTDRSWADPPGEEANDDEIP